MTDLFDVLDEYDPDWRLNFATLRDACEHFGLDAQYEDAKVDEEYQELDFNDGQPDSYTEWQDYMGGDDWDHGQYD